MAVFAVEFSHGLSLPFMWLSVGKLERNHEESEDKPERNTGRSERKQRASKRAIQKAA